MDIHRNIFALNISLFLMNIHVLPIIIECSMINYFHSVTSMDDDIISMQFQNSVGRNYEKVHKDMYIGHYKSRIL